jgi:hypothetical protein
MGDMNHDMSHSDSSEMEHDMDHSSMAGMNHGSPVLSGDLSNPMMGSWTNYELSKARDADYWL